MIAAAVSTPMSIQASTPLRVLSFNLRYINPGDTGSRTWVARRDQVGRIVRDSKPDLIGVQEAFRSMLDDVEERVPGYDEIGVGREDGKTAGEYAAILVRRERFATLDSGNFWLSDTPEIPNSKSWKNLVTRICTWARLRDKIDNREFYYYNTHLDHESQEAREKGVDLILKHLSGRAPVAPFVISGDFNAGEDNPAIAKVRSSPLHPIDSWRAIHPGVVASESGTMHGFTGARDGAKIDYIFVPNGTRVVESEIIHDSQDGNYPSDHFPILSTFELAP